MVYTLSQQQKKAQSKLFNDVHILIYVTGVYLNNPYTSAFD